jgi:hypothetical protein
MAKRMILLAVILILAIIGCEEQDERVVRVTQEAAARQAEQNEQMAEIVGEVAQGSRQLVEADGLARQEILQTQAELVRQQAEIAQRCDELDAERRALAQQRNRQSLLVPVISSLGLLLLSCLPLVLAWYLLHAWYQESAEETAMGELLLEELASERPLLLPQPVLPPAIEPGIAPHRLAGPDECDEVAPTKPDEPTGPSH